MTPLDPCAGVADMKAGGRPPRAEKNIAPHWEEVVQAQAAFRKESECEPFTVLIGKSMGSRIGCHVAAEDPNIADAVVCLGYPLVGMNGKLRDEVLKQLRVPTLLCQVRSAPPCYRWRHRCAAVWHLRPPCHA